jgi:UDP-N-acetylmuramoyl-L-alanyl-D-glutamate--2,6-diaminopimelate ligase
MIFDISETSLLSEQQRVARRPRGAMEITLRELLESFNILTLQGDLDVPVTGLCIDSRKVVPGSLFFALSGQLTDGNYFAREAISRGACAIISSAPPMEESHTWVQVPDARSVLAWVSRRFYGYPDSSMRVIGVTGTNGKTSVTMLAQHLVRKEEDGQKTALLGTIHNDIGGRVVPSKRTTAEAHELFEYLAKSRDAGCNRAIMEVSSHGVSQKRVLGLEFQTAVFMNLTPEHLDFHHSMEHYYQAKKTFVGGGEGNQSPKHAVLNIDDAYGKRLWSELPSNIRKVTFGEDMWADFRASQFKLSADRTEFLLSYPGGNLEVVSPLLGHFNVQNLLAALAAGWVEGFKVEEMLGRLQSFPGVPGRLERVKAGQDFNVIVDYAHTDDALENILSVLREVTVGRLLLVFGCGGDRDQDKRPEMTRTAQRYCDYVWATADNPRSEPLSSIFKQMEVGVRHPSKIKFVKERRRAIGLAIVSASGPGDCVVIAGKGHETYQEFGSTVIPFDDRRVAMDLLKLRLSSHRT